LFFQLKFIQGAVEKAVDPHGTAETIYHALASPTPLTYYATGDFKGIPAPVLMFLANTLPDRVFDWLRS